MKSFKEILIKESTPKPISVKLGPDFNIVQVVEEIITAHFVVFHFKHSYYPSVTSLSKSQVKEYFSEDMGFDPDDEIPAILGLKPKESWKGIDIQVMRIK